jgi:hypothetical protein
VGCLALIGCGGGDAASTPTSAPTAPPTQLDTAEVLAIVQTRTSDTTEPFAVDNGAVTVTPADDETGEPISVDGT